ncbi:hypothetical protein RvY_19138 [Ramazzottius varieornatus]|uniref:Uncharacterized protein n=1 Tax=Ramazzottius varieornatus TaxID=947166 RepID=A0A1D1WBM3_RAMVA|nr:hypothetical protein RvY_19138 [Ramazzottius varieornatus]
MKLFQCIRVMSKRTMTRRDAAIQGTLKWDTTKVDTMKQQSSLLPIRQRLLGRDLRLTAKRSSFQYSISLQHTAG